MFLYLHCLSSEKLQKLFLKLLLLFLLLFFFQIIGKMISLVLGKTKSGEIWKIWFIPNRFQEVSEWVYICSNLFSPSYSQLGSQSSGLDFQRRTWRSKCSCTTFINPTLYKLCVCMWGMCVHACLCVYASMSLNKNYTIH